MIINNLGLDLGDLSDTIEVLLALLMMIGGIVITYLIQKWADRAGEHPGAVNVGKGGGANQYQQRTMRR